VNAPPERLYACRLAAGGILADDVIDIVVLGATGEDGPVAEYVLASKAAAQRDKALDEKHAQLVSVADRLRGKVSAAEAETAALRRERDALAAATSDVARVFWRREAEVRLSALRAYLCDIGERGETDLRERAFVASIERSLREDDAAAKGVG